jgi:hypothetical protein
MDTELQAMQPVSNGSGALQPIDINTVDSIIMEPAKGTKRRISQKDLPPQVVSDIVPDTAPNTPNKPIGPTKAALGALKNIQKYRSAPADSESEDELSREGPNDDMEDL